MTTTHPQSQRFEALLSEAGPFADFIAGFKSRVQQIEMAHHIAEAIEKKEWLVIEAGTGVGKTLAYLVPTVLSGKKIIISTGTKYLQDQIYFKDLPTVIDALGVSIRTALLKGRANYLCLENLDRRRNNPRLDLGQNEHIEKIYAWSQETRSGDIADFQALGESDPLWSSLTSTPESCLGSSCPFYKDCFVVEARKKAIESDLVIVNHYLLLADMTLKEEGFGTLLPTVDTVIVDEAHKLNDVADSFFGETISSRQIQNLADEIKNSEIHKMLPEVKQCVDVLTIATAELVKMLQQYPERGDFSVLEKSEQVVAALERMGKSIFELEALLKAQRDNDNALASLYGSVEAIANNFRAGFMSDDDHISWYQRYKASFNFHVSPIHLAPLIKDKYSLYNANWIYTSATLSVDGKFDYIRNNLGLDDIGHSVVLDSPFDFKKQAALYIPDNLPEPNTPDYTARFIEESYPLLELANGSALFLFTSHKSLKEAASLLKKKAQFKLLVQGDSPKRDLVKTFSQQPGSLLLGTMGFWEGVDVRGAGLRCVIIDRLPFAQPSDPLIQGRAQVINQNGGNFFKDVSLPEAVVLLRQGVGRLIRDENDYGVVMIGDQRIVTRNYGKVFLHSLPPMKRFNKVAPLRDYIAL